MDYPIFHTVMTILSVGFFLTMIGTMVYFYLKQLIIELFNIGDE